MSSRPAHILYIIDTLKVGGAQLHLLDVIEGLEPQRFRASVCALGPATDLSTLLIDNGIEVRTLGLHNIYGPAALRELPRLRRWIRDANVDLVHTYLPSANVYGALGAWWAGVSTVVTSRRDMGFSRSWRLAYLEQLLVNPFVRKVVTVCDAVAQVAARDWFLDSDRIVTVYNGVDSTLIEPLSTIDVDRIRTELGLQAGESVITIVGSLTPVKAHEVFLEAASQVRQAGFPAVFVIVGDGPRREALESQVKQLGLEPAVHFTGEVPKKRVGEILAATDIGVSTSDTEGMSNALLDFMLHGKPIVATAVGGNPEVVEDGGTGILVRSRDPDGLATALKELLRDPSRAAELGEAGRRRSTTVFSRETMIRSLESLYSGILGSAKPSVARPVGL